MQTMKSSYLYKATVIVALLFTTSFMFSQEEASGARYQNAIGLRFYDYGEITYKNLKDQSMGFEVIANMRNISLLGVSYLKAKGLVEKHTPAFELEEWTWHYGAGAEAIIYNEENALTGSQSSFFFGIAGVAGLDYNFADYPVALSLNWIPVINILGATGNIRMFDASLSARYIIN